MTSPLANFANARILWRAAGTRSGGRDGFKVTPGQAYLIEAFLKRNETIERLTKRSYDVPTLELNEIMLEGYTIRFTQLTDQQLIGWETMASTLLTWTATMALPDGVKRDDEVQVFISGMGTMTMNLAEVASAFGHDGIGEIIKGVLGDRLVLKGGAHQ